MLNFFAALWGSGKKEFDKLGYCFTAVFVATIAGIVPILVFRPSMGICFWITLAPWLFTAYRLFSIHRFIGIHITGEILEFAHAPIADPKSKKPTSIFENPFIRTYLSVISGIFLVQTVAFLLLPLFVNYTVGGVTAIIVIVMLCVVAIIGSWTFFAKAFRFGAVFACVLYSAGLILYLFPQIGYYTGFGVQLIPASSAEIVRDIESLRNQQVEDANNAKLREALKWQKSNPTKQLPEEYIDVIEAAGRNLTVEEYKKQRAVENVARETGGKKQEVFEKAKSANPFWKETVHVNYAWTDENQGAVKIGILDPGSYNLKVKSDFKFEEMKDGKIVMVVPIGPKGLVGRIVATQPQLPMPSASFGARLVRVGDGPWQLLGEEATINLTEKSDVYVTINVRRIPDNFYNQGGDDITIKRSW